MLRGEIGKTIYLSINEVYSSIQGEGLLIGLPVVFIRFQGCNLRCPWCDQPSALSFSRENQTSTEDLLKHLSHFPTRHVVLTGGEPMAQEGLTSLVEELISREYFVQIETNGTIWQKGLEAFAEKIHITCSPKWVAHWFVHPKVLQYAKELKFVVDEVLNEEVLLKPEFRRFLEGKKVVLQPEGNKPVFFEKALSLQTALLKLGFTVRVLPQVHKLFGVP
ncbi:7-carboxy-7-deazaguanine synthase QueE [Thermocrinis sp.]